MKVNLPKDGTHEGTIIRRKLDSSGKFVGKSDPNPYIDTSIYQIEFSDGKISEYNTNIIAKNLYATDDDLGQTMSMFSEITDH